MAERQSATGAATVTQPINPYEAEVKTIADNSSYRKSPLGFFTWISCICAFGQAFNDFGRFIFGFIALCVSDVLRGPKMASQIRVESWWVGFAELTYAFIIIGVPCSFLAVLLEKKRRWLAVFFLVINLGNLAILGLIYYIGSQFFSKLQG